MGSENKICFLFHSTHPRRVWRIVLVSLILVQTVSIHTPTKGVTQYLIPCTYRAISFNPHTHEGCDAPSNIAAWETPFVSIHTPTKGVTSCSDPSDGRCTVSIHTPTKGVTPLRLNSSASSRFQSTHPRRVWLQLLRAKITVLRVSIHTPTKGVTIGCKTKQTIEQEFQSTHPRRVWQPPQYKRGTIIKFQSTHPRRVWLPRRLQSATTLSFQSTHPRRVWLIVSNASPVYPVFQSTHPRRVWQR